MDKKYPCKVSHNVYCKVYRISTLCQLVIEYIDAFMYVPKDMCKIPNVDILDCESVKLFIDQTKIKQQLTSGQAEKDAVNKQLDVISSQWMERAI